MTVICESNRLSNLSQCQFANIQELVNSRNVTTRTLGDELAQLVLTKIQRKILDHPAAEQALREKGYDPEEKIQDYNIEVVNAIVPKLAEINAIFSQNF